jgi:hypothetical protein
MYRKKVSDMSTDKKIKNIFVFGLSFVAISLAYQNCGPSGSGGASISASNTETGDIVAIPNTKTASIQRASRVLDNLMSCLGTGIPSTDAKRAYDNNIGTISEEGLANTMTQPMAKTLVSIAAEVCEDLLDKERAANDGNRKIFIGIDFNQGGVANTDLQLATKRIARSCWGRNPSSSEVSQIVSNTVGAFSSDDDNQNATRAKAVYLCTAIAASFAAFEM